MLVGKRFDAALATTNYDTLLHPSGATVTWQERDRLLAVLRGDHRPNRYPSTVAHLHGYWAEPDTVIFGDSDYERRAADSYAATLNDVIGLGTARVRRMRRWAQRSELGTFASPHLEVRGEALTLPAMPCG